MQNKVSIRQLSPDDWQLFKQLRLRALTEEPRVFSPSTDEFSRSDAEWRSMLESPRHAVFALFDGAIPIGLTGVVPDRRSPGDSALLVMSFIVKDYRGRGLSALLYQSRIDWVRSQGGFTRIVVGHREDNEPSRRAMTRFGFREISKAVQVWPDGTSGTLHEYELAL